MSAESHLEQLLARWKDLRERELTVSAEKLCADCPELLPELLERIRTLTGTSGDSSAPTQVGSFTAPVRSRFGRYRIEEFLGAGGFGTVYRAYDEELRRPVAIKVPHAERFSSPQAKANFLQEARHAARLDHPGIVPVYDVGEAEGECFVVYKLIEGGSLAARLKQGPLTHPEAALLVAQVAEALDYAHRQGLYHRDVKPGNILLDKSGKPYLGDLGLAIQEAELTRERGAATGTLPYASPEQLRGEGHRIDGRTDIYCLGTVLYQLLCGRRPFDAVSKEELIDRILHSEARPPRQINSSIPRELERICLKAMCKRVTDRYTTAKDMADELRLVVQSLALVPASAAGSTPAEVLWPATTPTGKSDLAKSPVTSLPAMVVPKGLRSFGPEDSEFFLELLPGPRDREGLPGSIRFWKTRIESRDPDSSFSVGVLYGPSGCGKSSLVKAGLLPRLSLSVLPIYVECTGEGTDARLAAALCRHGLAQRPELSPADLVAAIRRNSGTPPDDRKVLIILDQFEQWLHAHTGLQNAALVGALRQCDGRAVQCLIMVRDDFWVAISRFMQDLEIRLVEGQNLALVDLFDPVHARKVLAAFGRAFGRLPPNPADMTPEIGRFLDQAVAGLAQEGKVIPVRLSLFAEMLKGKPWVAPTLKEVGGIEGIGVTFLDEAFSTRTANPSHRMHQTAARSVLEALLPEQGSDIKGHMRSHRELLEASGYAERQHDFQHLLGILDTGLRLITPTEPEPLGEKREGSLDHPESGERFYQLTHDFLVPSLREWLTRKHKETRRGRAELRLADWAALWSARPHPRRLPPLWQWLSILSLTRRRHWTAGQHQMMRAATRHHLARAAMTATLAIAAGLAGLAIRNEVIEQQRAARGAGLVHTLLNADTAQVPAIIPELDGYRRWANPRLAEIAGDGTAAPKQRLHASLALLPVDRDQAEYLFGRLLEASPVELVVIRDALHEHQREQEFAGRLWEALLDSHAAKENRFRAALALAAYDPGESAASLKRWQMVGGFVTDELLEAVLANPNHFTMLVALLHPVRQVMVDSLSKLFRDKKRPESDRFAAASLLAEYLADDPKALADLISDADARQYGVLIRRLRSAHREVAVTELRTELQQTLSPQWGDPPLDPAWSPVDPAAVHQLEQAQGLITDRFALCQTMALDSFPAVAEALRLSGYRPSAFRPYKSDMGIRVAAVWRRDGADYQIAYGLERHQLVQHDVASRRHGYLPLDLAVYGAPDGTGRTVETYAALWGVLSEDVLDAKMYFASAEANGLEWESDRKLIARTNVRSPLSSTRASIRCRVNALLASYETWEKNESEYEKDLALSCFQVDVRLSPTAEGAVRYSAVWWDGTGLVSREEHGLGPEQHLERCRQLVAQGFQPASIAALWAAERNGALTASVWHRPSVSDDAKNALAQRQANAAVALLEVGGAAEFWPLLRGSPDPRLRTYLVHRLGPLGVEPQRLIRRFDQEADASVRRAILLSLGEYSNERLPDAERAPLVSMLRELYRDDPDAGIHSAAEFLLRRWGYDAERIEQGLERRGADPHPDRQWYVNGQGHTMVVIRDPSPFRMGSPGYEPGRENAKELLHVKRINREFSIATKEVTVEQFLRLFPDHIYDPNYSPSKQCPVNTVTWYDAARYCRRLSEAEGIDEEQMCYPPIEEIKEGMKLPPDFLKRTGYRLLTEAEWEYACRSGADTSRFFGQSEQLLSEYAWTFKNSGSRLHPVGSLKPNDLGLFDILGNVMEWCQDSFENYPWNPGAAVDPEAALEIAHQKGYVLRGGAFLYQPSNARSAQRDDHPPFYERPYAGFRVARTLPQ